MTKRIEYVDGLRAIAVLSVLAFHAGVHSAAITSSHSIGAFLLRQGCHGVDLFFVLSGFCLAYPSLYRLHTYGHSPFDTVSFAARRIVRIVPPYYAAIAVMLAGALVLGALHIRLPESMPVHGFTATDVVRQALFLDRDVRLLDASFWTLAIEFRWYFLFPVVLWVWTKSPRAFFALALCAFLTANTNMRNIDFAVLPTFMLGIVAADAHIRGAKYARWALPAGLLLAALAAFSTRDFPWNYVSSPLWGPAMFCFVVSAGELRVLRGTLASRTLVFTGAASYGIYLVHEPVISFVSEHAPRSMGLVTVAAAAAAGLLGGIVFSILAERPFVSGPLRSRLVRQAEGVMGGIFARLAVIRSVRLEASPRAVATSTSAATAPAPAEIPARSMVLS